jgi:hypothetical protein
VFTRPAMRHTDDDLPVVAAAVTEAAAELSQRLGWSLAGEDPGAAGMNPEVLDVGGQR